MLHDGRPLVRFARLGRHRVDHEVEGYVVRRPVGHPSALLLGRARLVEDGLHALGLALPLGADLGLAALVCLDGRVAEGLVALALHHGCDFGFEVRGLSLAALFSVFPALLFAA